jgi:hypothetical protein
MRSRLFSAEETAQRLWSDEEYEKHRRLHLAIDEINQKFDRETALLHECHNCSQNSIATD